MEEIVTTNVGNERPVGKKPNKAFLYILISLGLVIAAYLLYRHHVLFGDETSPIDICSAVFGRGCDASLTSSVSTQLGLPLAAWGILYYVTVLVAILLPLLLSKSYKRVSNTSTFILTFFGAVGGIAFLAYMLLHRSLFCPLCAAIHTINLVIFCLVLRYSNFPFRLILREVLRRVKGDPGNRSKASTPAIGYATIALIAVSMYVGLHTLVSNTSTTNKKAFDATQNLGAFLREPVKSIPVDKDDPVLGPTTSPIELVVFSDFQCPSCRYFATVVSNLKTKFGDRFHLVYKHFPLGKACNSVISKNVHSRACEAAMAAEAAKEQGKFWEFHDSLFVTDLNSLQQSVSNISMKIGLDQRQFEQSRIGTKALDKITKTVQLAAALGIHGTPSVFLNGRFVKNFSLESMESLMSYQLDSLHKR